MLLHEQRHVGSFHVLIERSIGMHQRDWTEIAPPHATGFHDIDFLAQSDLSQLGQQRVARDQAAGTGATRSRANQNMSSFHNNYSSLHSPTGMRLPSASTLQVALRAVVTSLRLP